MAGVGDLLSRGTLLAVAVVAGCGQASKEPPTPAPTASDETAAPTPPPSDAGAREVAVYALSRGKGVPDATRAAREKARALLQQWRDEKRVLDIQETRIGIEGERRLCATFATEQDAAEAAARLRELGAGVELFNVALEPCAKPGAPTPPKGVKP